MNNIFSHTNKDAFRVFFSFEAFKKYIFKVVFSKVVKRTILIFRVAKHSVQLILYLRKPKLYCIDIPPLLSPIRLDRDPQHPASYNTHRNLIRN